MPKVTGPFPGRLSPVQSTWAETMRISLGNIPLGQEAIRGAQKPPASILDMFLHRRFFYARPKTMDP
jgi:hypothetical protein